MGEICIEVLTKRNLVLGLPIPIALDSAGTTASDLLSAGLEARREVVEILAVVLVQILLYGLGGMGGVR